MNKKSGKNKTYQLSDLKGLWKSQTSPADASDLDATLEVKEDDKIEVSDRKNAKTLQSWKRGGGAVHVTKAIHNKSSSKQSNSRESKNNPGNTVSHGKASSTASKPLSASKKAIPRQKEIPTPAPKIIQPEKDIVSENAVKVHPIEKLREISADINTLKIGGAKSPSIKRVADSPVVESQNGRIAILGLDFGTAFTKAVISLANNHYAVDWSSAVEGEDSYLLASMFSEHDDGECVLGSFEGARWKVHEGIKLKLLSSQGPADLSVLADAVIFLGLVFRYANQWFRESRSIGDDDIRWRLHVGLPTLSWDNSNTTETFKKIAQAARLVAISPGMISRKSALQAIKDSQLVARPAVDVFPEFACQLYSYLRSSERQDDLHALVDVGAGTVDVAFFNVFENDDGALLPIFSADVQKLGAHYLIAALVGRKGANHKWDEGASSLSAELVAEITNESINEIASRRTCYLSRIADMFNAARIGAKNAYETSPAFQRNETIRLFLCGGGSRIKDIKSRFEMIVRGSEETVGVRFQLSELVRPSNIVGKFGTNFDRLSVAYGLSQIGANIGNVMRSADLKPLRVQDHAPVIDRDDDR